MKKIVFCCLIFWGMHTFAERAYTLHNRTPFSVYVTYPVLKKTFRPGTRRVAQNTTGTIGTWVSDARVGDSIVRLSILRLKDPIDLGFSTSKKKNKKGTYSFKLPGTIHRWKPWRDLKAQQTAYVGLVGNKGIYLVYVRGKKPGEVYFFLTSK